MISSLKLTLVKVRKPPHATVRNGTITMSRATVMTSSEAIRTEIQAALDKHPELKSATISIAAKKGVVTIGGFVQTLNQKWIVEDVVKSVEGITAIVNEIEVRLPGIDKRPDTEIANDILTVLGLELGDAVEGVKVAVENGAVSLEGQVASKSQRLRASELAAQVRGVVAVSNDLEELRVPTDVTLKRRIEDTFRRSAEIDANNILVDANEGHVVLSGAVRSWAEREEAEQVAKQMPGVHVVENHIVITLTRQGVSP
jgi:osmotically-inducible protein OsmY